VRLVYPGGSARRPVIGLSTHAADEITAGLAGPADYLAIGPVYPTGSKADAESAVGLEGVRAAAALTRVAGRPLVAIGGITAARAPEVLAAGADSVAVISALLDGGPAVAARTFRSAISA
jgi:thiamine-phosphate pyrophosphorylase